LIRSDPIRERWRSEGWAFTVGEVDRCREGRLGVARDGREQREQWLGTAGLQRAESREWLGTAGRQRAESRE
jgi:hypothetical protein